MLENYYSSRRKAWELLELLKQKSLLSSNSKHI